MSDVTNKMFGQRPHLPDGMTPQQALILYLYIPTGIAICFGFLKAAMPDHVSQTYAVLAWMLVFIPTWAAFEVSTHGVSFLFRKHRIPLWAVTILGAFISGIYLKPYLIWVSEDIMGIALTKEQKTFPDYIWLLPRDISVFAFLWMLANVTALGKFGVQRFGYTPEKSSQALMDTTPVAPTPAWLAPYLAKGILAVEAEDHYVHIHTRKGKTIERRRFSDVISALGHVQGIRVHRSWWVAKDAVHGYEKTGQRLTLLLENDLSIPVSRSYRIAAQNAGLLRTS